MDIRHHYQPNATVHQLFVEAAVTHSDKIALVAEEGCISYADLFNFAQNFSILLRKEYAVVSGDMVGLAAGRSLTTIGAILGILMCGAAYVPFDVAGSPPLLLARQIKDSGISLVVVDSKSSTQSCSRWWEGVRTLPMPESFEKLQPLGEVNSVFYGGPQDPAYVMFTSGSTGTPKGVVVPHRAVTRLVSAQEYIQFDSEQRFLLHSPLSFDASTLEVWGALLHGATLVIAPDRVLSLEDYAHLVKRYHVTTLWMTAAMFHLAVQHSPSMFMPLRQLLVGGDVVRTDCVVEVQRSCPQLQIVNGYGPTESTTFALTYQVPKHFESTAPLPIGVPIAHTNVYILDEQHRLVEAGEAGELAIGGEGVALGYISQPELTEKRFLPSPFGAKHDRLYLTGDRVRRDLYGIYHFLGRFDREQKIAGRRVDLDEVEALLAEHHSIRQAATLTLAGEDEEKQLYAAVAVNADIYDGAAVRDYLASRLPKSCLPLQIIVLPQLPLNSNGKLDRTQIRQLIVDRLAPAKIEPDASIASASTLETVLLLWRKLLNQDALDEDANFFDLGGNSLLLIEMHAALNKKYPQLVDMMDLFTATTPSKISELIDSKQSFLSQGNIAV
ncbi:non-ribosomal peptide synthetase [Acidipila rosea]|uniref:Amino acid adenylation domain-containing protein n=1 Tax=Acidipila rosea TaxID=768535 RepID=A0A4R1LCZ8_9BACT|nr:non-ribosomal peptide synthetase [Acidipila rosea]MBW4027380.1 non-ribosomal peptide synthetase [Acidobacteriota bacterium]TCK75547.1 amino acid adenylation domain-containing protein [Acidipila rosea]